MSGKAPAATESVRKRKRANPTPAPTGKENKVPPVKKLSFSLKTRKGKHQEAPREVPESRFGEVTTDVVLAELSCDRCYFYVQWRGA